MKFQILTTCAAFALVIAPSSVWAQDAESSSEAQDFISDFLEQGTDVATDVQDDMQEVVNEVQDASDSAEQINQAMPEPIVTDPIIPDPVVPENNPAPVIEEQNAQTSDTELNPPSIFDDMPSGADTPAPAFENDFPAQPAPVEVTDVPPPPDIEFAVPTVPAIPPAPDLTPRYEPAPQIAVDDDLFFDSESLVPQGEMTKKGTLRRVNPQAEQASRLMVVRKNYNPSSMQAQLVSAGRALKLGRYESALEIYNGLFARDDQNPNILLGRAIALQKLGRDDAAIQAYEQLLYYKPDNVEANVNLLGLLGKRYPAVAQRRLVELRERNPNNVPILAQLAVVEANVGRYQEALKYLGIASGLEPTNAGHLYNMAVIADRAGEQKIAVQYYEQALETDSIHGGSRSVPREQIFVRLAQLR